MILVIKKNSLNEERTNHWPFRSWREINSFDTIFLLLTFSANPQVIEARTQYSLSHALFSLWKFIYHPKKKHWTYTHPQKTRTYFLTFNSDKVIKHLLGRKEKKARKKRYKFPLLDTLLLISCFLHTLQMFLLKSLFLQGANGSLFESSIHLWW